MVITKKIFKEKTSIKKELQNALDNNTPITASILAKLVGISLYRVKKYCKSHNIDLSNYDVNALNQKQIKTKNDVKEEEKARKRKIKIGEPIHTKIHLEPPKNIRVKLKDN